MRVVVVNQVSLDGVMQGPGRPDEDTRDGFRHGGWAWAATDAAMGAAMSRRMGTGFAWLLGRRSYEEMLAHWNQEGGPFKDGLNEATKYVVSSHTDLDLPWPNSRLLGGDVVGHVEKLRARSGGNLVVMGSGRLVRSLWSAGLVDELFVMIHPVVLGSGRRLFGPDEEARRLELVESASTSTGVLMCVYRPVNGDG